MTNRHYSETIYEVWESFEKLMKSKLVEIDHMTRQMFKEMQATKAGNETVIRNFLQEHFAMLWDQVAAEQEIKSRKKAGGWPGL